MGKDWVKIIHLIKNIPDGSNELLGQNNGTYFKRSYGMISLPEQRNWQNQRKTTKSINYFPEFNGRKRKQHR